MFRNQRGWRNEVFRKTEDEQMTGSFITNKKPRSGFLLLLACICVLAFVSCQKEEKMKDPKGALAIAAEKYWKKRLLEKDYTATYDMEAAKNDMSLEAYKKKVHNAGQIGYLSIKIEDVKVEDQKGSVKVVVSCMIQNVPEPVELSTSDKWVIEGNEWKHVLKEGKSVVVN
jgi:hypothetical protein